jgi:hypothetical protein
MADEEILQFQGDQSPAVPDAWCRVALSRWRKLSLNRFMDVFAPVLYRNLPGRFG